MPCGTDNVTNRLKATHPEIIAVEAQLEQEIQNRIMNGGLSRFAKGTGLADTTFDVPVVFHVIHDYGSEYVSDNEIYACVADMNQVYSGRNADTVGIIPPFTGNIPGTNIPYKIKSNIVFHLATKDPQGNPTHGITRRRSYLSYNAGDEAKFDQWPPDSYINIWLVRTFSGAHTGAAAYAYPPSSASNIPSADGVITLASYLNYSHTIPHEVGHVLNLQHPWGNTNNPEVACGNDGVDDTPPTKGHLSTGCVASALYDTTCTKGYTKTYTAAQSMALFGDATHLLVNYPDTVNAQNIMDYTYCARMLTYQQGLRMRAALQSSTAGRNNLISQQNLTNTGALAPFPDLVPIADFSTSVPFVCADGDTYSMFTNRSWNDTLISAAWTFSNGASHPTSTSMNNVSGLTFTEPGWVTVSLTATGNGTGSNTITKKNILYAADPNAVKPSGNIMSFEDSARRSKWPLFNYYNTDHKWETVSNTGVDDNYSVRFTNVDSRNSAYPSNLTQDPTGVYGDFYSQAYDLSGINANTKLAFAYAGAYRTSNQSYMNDRLLISFSVDCGLSWFPLDSIVKGDIGTQSYVAGSFTPTANQWSWHGTSLTDVAGEPKVFFRFRFISGTDNSYYRLGTGNNFYMDHFIITNDPLGVDINTLNAQGITLAPNPTAGDATLTIKGGDNSKAEIRVMDITGKLVYSTNTQLSKNTTQVIIPSDRISVKGMYMVEVITNGKAITQKLVVL